MGPRGSSEILPIVVLGVTIANAEHARECRYVGLKLSVSGQPAKWTLSILRREMHFSGIVYGSSGIVIDQKSWRILWRAADRFQYRRNAAQKLGRTVNS